MFKLPIIIVVFLSLCAFTSNKGDGVHIEYFKKNVITEGSYENGVKTGQWRFYFPNKKINIDGEFSQDKRTGTWQFFNNKGKLISKADYENDQLHGSLAFFDEKESLSSKQHYQHGAFTGLTEWFDGGILHHRIFEFEGGRKVESFYSDGTLKSSCNEWNGKQNDTALVYHANGQLKEELIFYRNLLLNVPKSNAPDGKPHNSGNLTDGEGLLIRYYDNGSVKSRVFYKSGLKNGIAQFYHENGELSEAGVYNAGRRSGIWKYFATNGDLAKEEEFRHNVGDVEFENEFSFSNKKPIVDDTEAAFPGGNRGMNKFIKEQVDSLEFEKGSQLWLSIKVDNLGFPIETQLKLKKVNGELKEITLDDPNLPRCVPAFTSGLPVRSEIIHVLKN